MPGITRSFAILLPFLLSIVLHAQEPFWMETPFNGTTPVTRIAVQHGNAIMISTEGRGVDVSVNYGLSWSSRNNGLPSPMVRDLAFTEPYKPYAIARTPEGAVYYTHDGGAFWRLLDSGVNGRKLVAMSASYVDVLASTDDSVMIMSSRFQDQPARENYWTPAGLDEPGVTQVAVVAQGWFSSSYTYVCFAATSEGKVFRGDYTAEPDPHRYGSLIAWSPLSSRPDISNIVGSTRRTLYAGRRILNRSTDDGETWSATGYAGDSITAIALNSPGHIFIGTRSGVYRSVDDGATWEPFNDGLRDMSITALAVDPRGYVFVGTASGKVYRSSVSSSTLSVDTYEQWPFALDLE